MTYLTFKDIAKELQVSVRTVSRMVADGLPVVHVGGRISISMGSDSIDHAFHIAVRQPLPQKRIEGKKAPEG